MKPKKLGPVPRSYYVHKEPSFDEYVLCEYCSDFVFEYCSIHGPLLVIPDEQVPKNAGPMPVPRAALTIPRTFLHLATSIIPGAGLGVFSTLSLPRGVRFGPYRGTKAQGVRSLYCWQLYDENKRKTHVIDASNPNASNWMRYVNCARHWREQNLVAYQYQGQIYYRTIKIIPRFTELMVFYGSEFAAALDVDLRRYFYDECWPQLTGLTPTKAEGNLASDMSGYVEGNHKENEITSTPSGLKEAITEYNIISIENKINIDGNIMIENNVTENGDPKKYVTTKKNLNIYCHICDKTFVTPYNLKRHNLNHIKDDIKIVTQNNFNCDLCPFPFETKNNLLRHKFRKHGQTFCPICKIKCSTENTFFMHLNMHGKQKKYSCPKCKYNTDVLHAFGTHIKTHMIEKNYKCDMCSYNTLRRRSIVGHLRRTHQFC